MIVSECLVCSCAATHSASAASWTSRNAIFWCVQLAGATLVPMWNSLQKISSSLTTLFTSTELTPLTPHKSNSPNSRGFRPSSNASDTLINAQSISARMIRWTCAQNASWPSTKATMSPTWASLLTILSAARNFRSISCVKILTLPNKHKK